MEHSGHTEHSMHDTTIGHTVGSNYTIIIHTIKTRGTLSHATLKSQSIHKTCGHSIH